MSVEEATKQREKVYRLSSPAVTLSDEGMMLTEQCLSSLRRLEPTVLRVSFGGYSERRKFVPVTLHRKAYWADVITGSIYVRDGGRCETGNATIEASHDH